MTSKSKEDNQAPVKQLTKTDPEVQAMLMNILLVNMGLLPNVRVLSTPTWGSRGVRMVVFDKQALQEMLSTMDFEQQHKFKRKYRKECRKAQKAAEKRSPKKWRDSPEICLFDSLMKKIKNQEE